MDVIKRNIVIISLLIVGLLLPSLANVMGTAYKTIFMIIAFEAVALFLSNIAQYVYTEIEFKKTNPNSLGYLFLGVHILVGLSVYSIYMLEGIKTTILPWN